MRLILLPSARRDLEQIWSNTAVRWSVDQADDYVGAINRRFESILDFPSSYPEYRTRAGLFRKAPSGEHLIFYQVTDRIEVVRILHNRVDVQAMLD